MFESLTCTICGGTMTKVSETEAVCTSNESHKRTINVGRRERITYGPLKDHPDHWGITGIVEGESRQWGAVRKPDGTYWRISRMDFGTPLTIGLGEQVTDATELGYLQSQYAEWLEKNPLST